MDNVDTSGNILNQIIANTLKFGPKSFNLNVARILNNNYAEFRHIGGKLDVEVALEKLLYFCYIVDVMTAES